MTGVKIIKKNKKNNEQELEIRNRYNQVQNLTQDTNGKVTH